MNPYDWQRHDPPVEIPRDPTDEAVDELRRGRGVVVIGGRGMGKSVILRQIRTKLESLPGMRVVTFSSPPFPLSAERCFDTLAGKLGVPTEGAFATQDLVERFLGQEGAPEALVLLFDEFDDYAQVPGVKPSESAGRFFFNNLEEARRNIPGLGIFAVGSIGTFVFRDVLGSGFLARASKLWLGPFHREEIRSLAEPFRGRGEALSEEVVEALFLATGGNPALATYGLQQMWQMTGPIAERDVADVFARFRDRHDEFMHDVERAFSDPSLSQAPQRVWELIRKGSGRIDREELRAACYQGNGPLKLKVSDALHLLVAAGLIRVQGSIVSDNPVTVSPIPSILSLPVISSAQTDFRQLVVDDLQVLLGRLHASSADFFRPDKAGTGKQLVPESVFSAFLALGFQLLGWRTEREAQYGAGRTDLKLSREGFEDQAIIEVKIWGRKHEGVHRQLEGYWSTSVTAGAVVMIDDRESSGWPEEYLGQCLGFESITVESQSVADSPVQARFTCASTTPSGFQTRIDHFLLRLARRS